ncbi:ABC transporter substrate-binding protein [Pseudonocardia sp. WMMC193]|uniref:ABC transporter substrate-binding protein n=1 Tax=Pseudonocardia sp. WMMC193 TaxID=2911965 RepID=UPI001F340282|nr:ABC transporter substrate-binding protein [Pseudonocardia sp. WMMC193]MCF7548394.1 ABC transporter substrate-binding protein [Pseudonocardia sp. WMMC193]
MPTPPGARRRTSALVRAVVSVLTLGLLVSACADTGGAASDAGPRDTVVVVTADQASNVVRDFGFTNGQDNQEVTNSLHAQLIRKPYIDEQGANVKVQDLYTFEPLLAESYDVSPDGKVFTFHLRHGLLSQQGNELTSEDVLWSFQRKFATKGGGMPGYYAPMLTDLGRQLQAVDRYTVTFTIDQPGYGFTLLGNLAENIGSIYDSTYLRRHATPEDPYAVQWGVSDMLNGNVGFGPYMLQSVTPNQEIVMVANPNYVFGPLPIQTIIRRVVPDAATRANMVANGDADIALDLRPADQADLASNPDVFTPKATSNLYQSLTMNTTKAPFDKQEVRQALAYAIPYDQIVDEVYRGRAYSYRHLLDDKAPYYDGSQLPDYTFDPAKAKELLAAAGVTAPVPFTLTVSNATPSVQDSAVLFAAAAKEAGFEVTINEVPAAQMSSDGLAGKLQASMATGSAVTMSPPYQLQLVTQPGGGANTSFWSGPTYDAFASVLKQGLAGEDAIGPVSGPLWSEAEAMMLRDGGTLFLARVMSPYSMRADVKGYAQRTDRRIDYSVLTAG